MRVLPNPAREGLNRRKHRLDFSRTDEMFRAFRFEEPDDRPLGYEHEARTRMFGSIGGRVVVLVYEPVELDECEIAARPISLRKATREEQAEYWARYDEWNRGRG